MPSPPPARRLRSLGLGWLAGLAACSGAEEPVRAPPPSVPVPLEWRIAGCLRLEHRSFVATELGVAPRPVELPSARCRRIVDAPRLSILALPAAVIRVERAGSVPRWAEPRRAAEAGGDGGSGAPVWHRIDLEGDGVHEVRVPSTGQGLRVVVEPFVRGPPLRAARWVDTGLGRATTAADEARGLLAVAHPRSRVLDLWDSEARAELAHRAGQLFVAAGHLEEAAVAYEIAGFHYDPFDPRAIAAAWERAEPPRRWVEGHWAFHKQRAYLALWLDLLSVARVEARAALEVARELERPDWIARATTYGLLVKVQDGLPIEEPEMKALLSSVDAGELSTGVAQWVLLNLGWARFLSSLDGETRGPSAVELLIRAARLRRHPEVDRRDLDLNLAVAAAFAGAEVPGDMGRARLEREAQDYFAPWRGLVDALDGTLGRSRRRALESSVSDLPGVEWLRLQILAHLLERVDPDAAIRVLQVAMRSSTTDRTARHPRLQPRAGLDRRGTGNKLVRLLAARKRWREAITAARTVLRDRHRRLVELWGIGGPAVPRRGEALPLHPRLWVERFGPRTVALLALPDGTSDGRSFAPASGVDALASALRAFEGRLRGARRLDVVWTEALDGVRLADARSAASWVPPRLVWTLDLGAGPSRPRAEASSEPTVLVDTLALEPELRAQGESLARRGPDPKTTRLRWSAEQVLFVGHGEAATGAVDARLFFEGETWWARELYRLPRMAETVGMLACSAGGGARKEARTAGVAQALLLAGAQTVVAPRGVISQAGALRFADHWLDALDEGEGPEEAFFVASRAAASLDDASLAELELWIR